MSDVGAKNRRRQRPLLRQATEGIAIVTGVAAAIALLAFLLAVAISLAF